MDLFTMYLKDAVGNTSSGSKLVNNSKYKAITPFAGKKDGGHGFADGGIAEYDMRGPSPFRPREPIGYDNSTIPTFNELVESFSDLFKNRAMKKTMDTVESSDLDSKGTSKKYRLEIIEDLISARSLQSGGMKSWPFADQF